MTGDASDVGKWEALIGLHSGIEHASAVVDGLPEDAVYAAMARGFQKYGPHLDYTQWTSVTRSFPVSAVRMTFFRKSSLPLTHQIPPVMDAATLIALTLFHRARPPCASRASFRRSFIVCARFLLRSDSRSAGVAV
jgi:hypothetical protein